MSGKNLRKGLIVFLSLSVFLLCLLPERFVLRAEGTLGSVLREILAAIRSAETQWMVFLSAIISFAIVILFQRGTKEKFWRIGNRDLWLTILLIVGAISYACNYPIASQSTDALSPPRRRAERGHSPCA